MATLLNVSGVTINTPNTTSPQFTYPSAYTQLGATLTLQIADATDPTLTISVDVQNSPDGGTTWKDYFKVGWGGGPDSGTGPGIEITNAFQQSSQQGRVIITPSRIVTNVTVTVTGT